MKELISEIFSKYILTMEAELFADYFIKLVGGIVLFGIIIYIYSNIRKNKMKQEISEKKVFDTIRETKKYIEIPMSKLYENHKVTLEKAITVYYEYLLHSYEIYKIKKKCNKEIPKKLVVDAEFSKEENIHEEDNLKLEIVNILFDAKSSTDVKLKITNTADETTTLNMGIAEKALTQWFEIEINNKTKLKLIEVIGKEKLKNNQIEPKESIELTLMFSSLAKSDIRRINKIRMITRLKKTIRGEKIFFVHKINITGLNEQYYNFYENTFFSLENNIIFISLGGYLTIAFFFAILILLLLSFNILSKSIGVIIMLLIMICAFKLNLVVGKYMLNNISKL